MLVVVWGVRHSCKGRGRALDVGHVGPTFDGVACRRYGHMAIRGGQGAFRVGRASDLCATYHVKIV